MARPLVVLATAMVLAASAACSESGLTDSTCPQGEIRYVGHGLTVLVPDGAEVGLGGTDDPGPVHAEAGAAMRYDGGVVTVWRWWSDSAPPQQGRSGVAVRSQDADDSDDDARGDLWFVVESDDTAVSECVLATVSYDGHLDGADP